MVGRGALREYVRGSLWVLPGLSVLAALAAGAALSSVRAGPRSPLAFQGTPDDARTLLLGITGTMITIIALLLGLAVVALQLSSTQFSPRLLRNFLRDRPNQLVLSAFVATFAYSAAGLYTVGVSGGNRTAAFPRLAVSGAIVLLFASLGLLVFFADHLLHSIQVDAIMETVQRNTLAVMEEGLLTGGQEAPGAPAWPSRSCPGIRGTFRRFVPGGCCRAPPGTACACACGPGSASTSWPGQRWPGSGGFGRRSCPGPGGLRPDPGQRGPDRVRADPGAGRRIRDPAARRRGVQGAVPGGQRPVYRREAVDHLSVIFWRWPGGRWAPTSPATAGGRDGPGPAVRRLPRGDVRAHPPLRSGRADPRARAAAPARQLRRRSRGRPRAPCGHRRAGPDHRRRRRPGSRPARGPRLHPRQAESVLQAVARHQS